MYPDVRETNFIFLLFRSLEAKKYHIIESSKTTWYHDFKSFVEQLHNY